ncbi:hypothetical protein M8J76_016038 [Diaphorina citri]|nr:hypothetical protein M8J76_016038 [Diaphorina citri]
MKIENDEEIEKFLIVDEKSLEKEKFSLDKKIRRTRTDVKIKYPKSVFFIITNEFCERFCYYGMKTVLYLYMLKKLHYEENNATVLYHSWAGLCYFFPIFGGIIADTFLGKFK